MAGSEVGNGAAVSSEIARAWIERWDRQQEGYLPDREDRFTALIDALEEAVSRADPLVLDLGCGPGSLAARILARLPKATVVAVDADPLTLALGRAAYQDLPGLRFVDADLRSPGWSAGLGLDRELDAAVSTTALHWLTAEALATTYAEVAGLLAPGGLVLNGDHMREDDGSPTLVRLGRAMEQRQEQRLLATTAARPGAAAVATDAAGIAGASETWDDWWAAAAADPALAPHWAEREQRRVSSEHHGSPAGLLTVQTHALRAAGFIEVGTLWQRGVNRLLCGVRPA